MGIRKNVKLALVLLQVILLASAFFVLFSPVTAILFILSEISFAEVADFLALAVVSDGLGAVLFLETLAWVAFKKNRKVRK